MDQNHSSNLASQRTGNGLVGFPHNAYYQFIFKWKACKVMTDLS